MKRPRLTVRMTRSDRAALAIGVVVFLAQLAAVVVAGFWR